MKNTLLTLGAALLLSCPTHAQLSMGLAFGIGPTTFTSRIGNTKMTHDGEKKVLDFRLGALANVPLDDNLALQPGIFYSTNGFYWTPSANSSEVIAFNLNAIEIPLNITYKTGKKGHSHFFFGAGPFAAIHLGGTVSIDAVDALGNPIGKLTTKIAIGPDTASTFRRLGLGVGFNAGYQLKGGLFFRAYYQQALRNLLPEPLNKSESMTNSNFGISIGYLFALETNKATRKKVTNEGTQE